MTLARNVMTYEQIETLMLGEFTKINEARTALKNLEQLNDQSELGLERLQKIKQAVDDLRKCYRSKKINFIALHQGRLAVGGRPNIRKIEILSKLGVDIVITLLREKEGKIKELGVEVEQQGMQWVWFPLSASTLPRNEKFLHKVTTLFGELQFYLESGKTLYIHCAAGIHRTGSFANAFLQSQNYTALESKQLVKAMREVTAREAVDKHWAWAECFCHRNMTKTEG